MFTFFKPKNKHQISYTKYVSQEQRYKTLLEDMQKEFSRNQELMECLRNLKELLLNQVGDHEKKLFFNSLKFNSKRIEQFKNLCPAKIDDLLNDLMHKQNQLNQDHHIFNHVKEELKINQLERRTINN